MKKCKKNVIGIITIVVITVAVGIMVAVYNELKTKVYTFPENFVDYEGLPWNSR